MTEFSCDSGAATIESLLRTRSSLLASKNSLFESVGNSGPTGLDLNWNLFCAGLCDAQIGELPCIFPVDQGLGP